MSLRLLFCHFSSFSALPFSLLAAWASNRGSELVDVLLGDSLPLYSCTLGRDWNGVHLSFWSVHCPPSICHSPRNSNHAVDGFCVPSVLRFQSPDFTSSEHTICNPNETLCTVVSHSKPNSVLISGVHPVHRICDLSCQHLLSERDEVLCRLLAVKSLKWCPPVTTFLTPGQDTSGMLHQPWHDGRVVIEWFLHPALNVALGCSNDSTQQHYRVLDKPI